MEVEECQIRTCVTCENFPNFCMTVVNTECVDETVNDEIQATCVCKDPFILDESGECLKCSKVRPFSSECASGESEPNIESNTISAEISGSAKFTSFSVYLMVLLLTLALH